MHGVVVAVDATVGLQSEALQPAPRVRLAAAAAPLKQVRRRLGKGAERRKDLLTRAVGREGERDRVERVGARLVGIDVERVFAISFGIGLSTLGAAACLLMPIFYVSPTTGHVFVMVAFTVVVLGGMGSFLGAVIGGLIVGLTESFGGLFLGESLGQIGISLIFILILLFRPSGLFGAKR
jgi:hypothetical protein